MGFGADGRPSEALASNQGHLLWALSVSQERARAIRDSLMSEAMFSGWGIRTLALGEAGYNPVGYHSHGVAARHGDDRLRPAQGRLRRGLRADLRCATRRGVQRGRLPAARALRRLLAHGVRDAGALSRRLPAAGLGGRRDSLSDHLRPGARARRTRAPAPGARPSIPRWLNRVEVRGLRVAGARVDLLFERAGAGEQVAITDARIEGDVEVVLEISGRREPADAPFEWGGRIRLSRLRSIRDEAPRQRDRAATCPTTRAPPPRAPRASPRHRAGSGPTPRAARAPRGRSAPR